MVVDHRYAEYRRLFWPWEWGRWWLARRRSRQPVADGRVYVGWSALLRTGESGYPAGTAGIVVDSRRQCGDLVHDIDFGEWRVTTPLPSRLFTLISPG